MKLTLKQDFILVDETCAKHASVLEGLQSFAGAEIGANQRIHETLQRLSGQMGVLQQKTLELEKNTSLDWRMQSTEDDINALQSRLQGGNPVVGQDRVISQLSQQVQSLTQNRSGSPTIQGGNKSCHERYRISIAEARNWS